MTTSFHDRILEVERLADTLKDVLKYNDRRGGIGSAKHRRSIFCDDHARYGQTSRRDGLYTEAHGLARWAADYQHGLHYGLVEGENQKHGEAWIMGIGHRFKLESGEIGLTDDEDEESDDHIAAVFFIESVNQVIRNLIGKEIGKDDAQEGGGMIAPVDARKAL